MFNNLKHIWNKVYCDVDIPGDRATPCTLDLKTALMRCFLPTTKRINEDVKKPLVLCFIDIIGFVPRLAFNLLKLVTEVLTLSLRELAYAAFIWMITKKQALSSNQLILKKLAQIGAGFFGD